MKLVDEYLLSPSWVVGVGVAGFFVVVLDVLKPSPTRTANPLAM